MLGFIAGILIGFPTGYLSIYIKNHKDIFVKELKSELNTIHDKLDKLIARTL